MPRSEIPLLVKQTADAIRTIIRTRHKPGDRLPRLAALCQQQGVSINTLRAAMAVLAREGIVESRHGSGIFVKVPPVKAPVGILVELDVLGSRKSAFWAQVASSLRRALAAQGVLSRLYVGSVRDGEDPQHLTAWDFVEDLKARRLDGVASISTNPFAELLTMIRDAGVPMVSSALYSMALPHAVGIDYFGLVREGVRRLVVQGSRRIGMLAWETALTPIFKKVLEEHGLDCRDRWIRGDLLPSLRGAGWEEFREIWSAYPDKPDGLLVCDDVLFREAIPAIMQAGVQVPDQLRIVAHANRESDVRTPFPLTLAVVDFEDYAREMGDMLLQLMRGQTPPARERLIPVHWTEVASRLAPSRAETEQAVYVS
jgi:DNA-binding LacI/PurR family transcriptional regulator